VWTGENAKHCYALSEKPELTMENGVFTLTTTTTTATYNAAEVLKFTLGDIDGNPVADGVDAIDAKAEPNVDRHGDRLYFTDCKPNSPIRIYGVGGQLVDTQWTDEDGRAELSLSGLKAGVYILKSDDITFKITKR
jgi:hypothetical protein